MRITERQRNAIVASVKQVVGDQAQVRLFGSRVYDDQKGGDIDLYIKLLEEVAQPAWIIARIQSSILLKIGDLKVDDEGYLTYVSRLKDVIISGGINIYPAEIEQCLLGSKLLSSVCVIGVNDSLLDEAVLAICVGDASAELKLRQLANQELVPYQRPIQYFFVEALPLTPSGKIDKMALREFYNNLGEDWSARMRAILYQ